MLGGLGSLLGVCLVNQQQRKQADLRVTAADFFWFVVQGEIQGLGQGKQGKKAGVLLVVTGDEG